MNQGATSRSALGLAGVVACAALVSSCALVLGFDDHEPYPADGGTGGLTGSGGSSATSTSSSGSGGSPHFGTPVTIASGQVGPSYIALDSSTVYWSNAGAANGKSEIKSIPKAGGEVFTLSSMQPDILGLTVDATRVWAPMHTTVGAYSMIGALAKGGTTTWPAQSYAHGGAVYFTIAMQGTVIAWSSSETGGTIFRGDSKGSAEMVVASSQGQVSGVALDGSTTYWVSAQQGAILRASGGTVDTFIGGQTSPTDIVLDADTVYWTSNDGTVKALSKSSAGGQPIVIANDAVSPQGIAVDGNNVYWAEADVAGRVRTAPKGGGKVETIATGQYPFDIAVDASRVYATMQGDGNIVAIDKK
ncbi:MAG: hypothetical protein QM820_57235 [Minicystis sp.]